MAVQSRCMLPQELIDAVVSDLSGDPAALKACALVCQNWRLIAQKHLFHTVKFDQKTMAEFDRCMNLVEVALSKNGNLVDFVRELCVQWVPDHLYKFLRQVAFTALEHVTMRHMSWVLYTDEALRCTQGLFKLPSMETIDLFDTTFDEVKHFGAFFEGCGPNIKTLCLHRVCFLKNDKAQHRHAFYAERDEPETREPKTPPAAEVEFVPENRPKLQSLEIIRGSASFLAEWFTQDKCPFNVSELKQLRYEEDMVKTDLVNLTELLKICSQSLECLDIYAPREPLTMKPNNLDISTTTMPNLSDLTISGVGKDSIATAIPWLSQLTHNSGIRKLTIKFRFGNRMVQTAAPQPTMKWEDLDNAVDNLPLMLLRDIEVKIPKLGRKTDEDVEKIYKTHLPRVAERSICKLTIL